MIRINLIPVPKARKQEALIIQAVVGVVLLVLTTAACYFWTIGKNQEIAQISQAITNKQREIEDLRAKVGEVEKFKLQLRFLQEQLSVIRSLEAGRNGPVRMMDALTDIAPRKLWITSFKENQKKAQIDGVAESGPIIADFLDNLKGSKYFVSPQLTVVNSYEQDGSKLHKFTITVQVKYDI